jgi:hypothetical protein
MKTKHITIMVMMMIMMFGVSGCQLLCDKAGWFCEDPPHNIPEQNIHKDVVEAQKTVEKTSITIEKATKEISTEANKISTEANKAQGKVPEEAKAEIDPHLESIKESSTAILEDTTTINKATAELEGAKSLLDGAEKKVVIVEEALDKMTVERNKALEAKKKAEADRDSALHKAIRWLILASIVGAGALGVFGFMYNSKMCLTLAAVCIVVMSIAIFVEAYFMYLVIGGGIILVALVGFMIYNIYVQKKAFKEVVDTVEITQENLPDEKRSKLFGGKGQTGIMDGIQSKSTMDLVQKEKGKMSNLWMYAKNSGDGK